MKNKKVARELTLKTQLFDFIEKFRFRKFHAKVSTFTGSFLAKEKPVFGLYQACVKRGYEIHGAAKVHHKKKEAKKVQPR